MDPETGDFEKADILIRNDEIAAIAPVIDVEDARVLDAAGMIVLPGFVDCHRHMWQTQLRGLTADFSLFDYSARIRSTYSSFYEPQDTYLGCYAGFLEAINAGTTTIIDHAHIMNSPDHSDEVVRAFKDSGIRGILCYGLFSNLGPNEDPSQAVFTTPQTKLDDARRIKKQHFSAKDGMLEMGLALTETEWFPLELTVRETQFAREIEAKKISAHAGMAALSRSTHFIDRLYRAGILGPDFLFVHGASFTARDLAMIADSGASVVSTPETELQMGMGFPVLFRALSAGVNAALGVDIVSNNSGDMFNQMRLNLQIQRALENDLLDRKGMAPKEIRLKVRDILEVGTIGGARAAGLDSMTGSLKPGKKADIIMIRTDTVNMAPVNNPVGSVVLCANASDVDTVLAGGKILKQYGKLVGVDWPKIAADLEESRLKIIQGGREKGFEKAESLLEDIFPITPKLANQSRIAGLAMRLPFLREPILGQVMKQMEAKTGNS